MMRRKVVFVLVSIFVSAIALPAAVASKTGITGSGPLPRVRPTPDDAPPFSSYKGVSIGSSLEDARVKLGNPKEKSDGQDSYEISGSESAQIYYDTSKKITAIMLTFSGKLDNAPTPKAVFGSDAEVKPDGGIFRMERYPKAGFWISYNKTGGDDPMIIIAIQKI